MKSKEKKELSKMKKKADKKIDKKDDKMMGNKVMSKMKGDKY